MSVGKHPITSSQSTT